MSSNGRGRPALSILAVGTRYKHLEVDGTVDPVLVNGYWHPRYRMLCDCGKYVVRTRSQIRKKPDAQCRSCASKNNHGVGGGLRSRHKREHVSWCAMWARCTNPKHQAYADYGARGIKVCKRWEQFDKFLLDMGPRPEGYTLERKNNNKGYTPKNCEWATRAAQSRNTRANVYLTAGGVMQTQQAWARVLGTSPTTIMNRLRRGWSEEAACSVPVAGTHRKVNKQEK